MPRMTGAIKIGDNIMGFNSWGVVVALLLPAFQAVMYPPKREPTPYIGQYDG